MNHATELTEETAVLALVGATAGEWYRTAALIESARSAVRLLRRDWSGFDVFDVEAAEALVGRVTADHIARAEDAIDHATRLGAGLVTILDSDYPINLRQIYNRPPFLFIRGILMPEDDRAIAIVGTRSASPEGLQQAGRLARELARHEVTVLSGMAHGIDTAAHEATLHAGGRTIAVMGTGIDRIYPPENRSLADDIMGRGALVSQFWPSSPPRQSSFPMRNVVMSGMALGTVVVEASATSGAKMQARLAVEHGKRLFLLESLVMQQPWAKRYAEHRLATVVKSVDDVLEVVLSSSRPVEQLSLG